MGRFGGLGLKGGPKIESGRGYKGFDSRLTRGAGLSRGKIQRGEPSSKKGDFS